MSIERKLIGTTDAATSSAVYVEDVFSTWLYNGTGSTQTITNGIDLATKGGLVWCKSRSISASNVLFSTTSANTYLNSNSSSEAQGYTPQFGAGITSYNVDGFTLGSNAGGENFSGTMVSWTFAKQAKFFDIVTYTGDGTNNRQIAHSLGVTPGMVIVKCTSSAAAWPVWHRSLSGSNYNLYLNTTTSSAAQGDFSSNGSVSFSSTTFPVSNGGLANSSGQTYVAYLFADSNSGGFGAAGTDSIVACGSFTAGNATVNINLGWEPQFVIVKASSTTSNWFIADSMRGMTADATGARLFANGSFAEDGASPTGSSSTGFRLSGSYFADGTTCIYLAIRRGPMRTPTDATKVFAPVLQNGGGTVTTNFPVDMAAFKQKDYTGGTRFVPRLTNGEMYSSDLSAESAASYWKFDNSKAFVDAGLSTSIPVIYWNFRRAPGFFDVVCYTGTGSVTTVAHNLGVAPELIIVKKRSLAASNWPVWTSSLLNTQYNLYLNSTIQSTQSQEFTTNSTPPTSTIFPVESSIEINQNGQTYVAYLFATCPGVSKVGSYTGNGSSQTIDCGFASGARFVLIKRTDSTGDWWVYDSARGIVAANDPALRMNSTAAEVTSADAVDPQSSGFIVNQEATCNINVSSATYIYLAIA